MKIEVFGTGELVQKFKRYTGLLKRGMEQAGVQSSEEILETEGLRKYPPETAANRPPVPYYIRGRGTQYASGNKGNSERYGTKWQTEAKGYITAIENPTSYGPYLGGSRQTKWAKRYGWRKLYDVAKEKMPRLTEIYSKWAEWARMKSGL